MINVLFICLGNICRSPMAEAVFRHMVEEAGLSARFHIDSAGTGAWHIGEPAHRGTRAVLDKNGIHYRGRARRVTAADYRSPESYIIAMDDSNYSDLVRTFGSHPRLYLLLDFVPHMQGKNVPDPYYNDNFDYVYDLVREGCRGLLARIRDEQKI